MSVTTVKSWTHRARWLEPHATLSGRPSPLRWKNQMKMKHEQYSLWINIVTVNNVKKIHTYSSGIKRAHRGWIFLAILQNKWSVFQLFKWQDWKPSQVVFLFFDCDFLDCPFRLVIVCLVFSAHVGLAVRNQLELLWLFLAVRKIWKQYSMDRFSQSSLVFQKVLLWNKLRKVSDIPATESK